MPEAIGWIVLRTGKADFVWLGRMVLTYPDLCADVLAGKPLQRKRICRTFSDCTTAPTKGLVSGCYPLDEFFRQRQEAGQLNLERVVNTAQQSRNRRREGLTAEYAEYAETRLLPGSPSACSAYSAVYRFPEDSSQPANNFHYCSAEGGTQSIPFSVYSAYSAVNLSCQWFPTGKLHRSSRDVPPGRSA